MRISVELAVRQISWSGGALGDVLFEQHIHWSRTCILKGDIVEFMFVATRRLHFCVTFALPLLYIECTVWSYILHGCLPTLSQR